MIGALDYFILDDYFNNLLIIAKFDFPFYYKFCTCITKSHLLHYIYTLQIKNFPDSWNVVIIIKMNFMLHNCLKFNFFDSWIITDNSLCIKDCLTLMGEQKRLHIIIDLEHVTNQSTNNTLNMIRIIFI